MTIALASLQRLVPDEPVAERIARNAYIHDPSTKQAGALAESETAGPVVHPKSYGAGSTSAGHDDHR